MKLLESMALWLRALLRRGHVETEMEKEMRLHLDLETENNIRLGMARDEARRVALVAFGGIEKSKEAVRDERGTRWLEEITADLRFALRGFRRQPLFAGGVILLTALGVGATSAIFSVFNNVLISPLPYADGNRMVQFTAMSGGGQVWVTPTTDNIDRWRARGHSVEQIVTYRAWPFTMGDTVHGPTEQVKGAAITPGAMAFVGARPVLGRDIQPTDTLMGAQPVTLISQGLWQRLFGGKPDALSKSIVLNGKAHVVIGVLPTGFRLPFDDDGGDVYTAFESTGANGPIDAMAKLRRGVSVDAANRELRAIFTDLDRSASEDPPRVMRAVDWVTPTTRRVVLLMGGAVLLVLIITCSNIANLLLARAWTRQREFAIRAAMGAHRARLVRQMFTESITLAVAGGVLGIGVAKLTLAMLVMAQPENRTDFSGARLEPVVLAVELGLCLLTGLLFGLAPALFVAGKRTNESLKAGTRAATASAAARRFRSALVVGEVALSAVLLVGSGLLVRTIVAMQRADIGMDPSGLMGISVSMRGPQWKTPEQRRAAIESMLDQVRGVPGVQTTTLAMAMPPSFATQMGALEIEGHPLSTNDSLASIAFTSARPELFAVTGGRITRGRVFADDPTLTDRVLSNEIVVNETFARRFWPNGDALGGRVRNGNGPWVTIVGVAADVILPSSKRAWNRTQFYRAMPAAPPGGTIIVRSHVPLATLLPSLESAIKRASPFIRIGRSSSVEATMVAARATHRFTLSLVGGFALVALLLAAFGLHAVVAFSVGQRTREIGVRVALGAQNADIMRLVVGQGTGLALAGVVIGAVGGVAAARAMRTLLYGTQAADPATLVVVSLLLGVVAVVASLAPARRAMRVDPVEALRSE